LWGGIPPLTTRLFTTVMFVTFWVVRMIVTLRGARTTSSRIRGARIAGSGTNTQAGAAIATETSSRPNVGPTPGANPTAGGSGAHPTNPPPPRQATQAGPQTAPGTHVQPYSSSTYHRP